MAGLLAVLCPNWAFRWPAFNPIVNSTQHIPGSGDNLTMTLVTPFYACDLTKVQQNPYKPHEQTCKGTNIGCVPGETVWIFAVGDNATQHTMVR